MEIRFRNLPYYKIILIEGNCKFEDGQARGGHGKEVRETGSAQQCLALVKSKKPFANGVTWNSNTHNCFAKFEATYIQLLGCTTCQSCIFTGGKLM